MRIFPVTANKKPIGVLVPNGLCDATRDEAKINEWLRRKPYCDWGWAPPASIGVVDVEFDGFQDFERLVGVHPDEVLTPQATTPRGGRHLIYGTGGSRFRNATRISGLSIDFKTAGGYVVLPGAGNGRDWVEGKPSKLAPLPEKIAALLTLADDASSGATSAIDAHESKTSSYHFSVGPPEALEAILRAYGGQMTRYGRALLEGVISDILGAPNGRQEVTLNKSALKVGRLIGAHELPEAAAQAVLAAGLAMVSYDIQRPWIPREIEAKVQRAVSHGLRA
jgi:hypothetical protein